MDIDEVKGLLEHKYISYNQTSFIDLDPVSIPHKFSDFRDIEISGFWTAMLSWGQRKTIINKANQLCDLMDNAPYEFIMNHREKDLAPFRDFKHRTFNGDDALCFIHFFHEYYTKYESLEQLFISESGQPSSIYEGISQLNKFFRSCPFFLPRTGKHVAQAAKNSSCKRINMFLRWMVRKDAGGVDFGIWDKMSPSVLMIPLDIHVYRVARSLGLLTRDKTDWKSVVELTEKLRILDPQDPVKYDYALFGMGVLNDDF